MCVRHVPHSFSKMTPLSFDSSPDPVLARALSVLASRIYICINPVAFEMCKQASFNIPEKVPLQFRASAESVCSSSFTWSPTGAKFFTIMKVNGDSLVYCHHNDTLYTASPQATLCSTCPDGLGFLAQYCEDKGTQPRLLVFDILSTECNPSKRGEHLRSLAHVFPSPLCSVQWVGFIAPLRNFIPTLPHSVEFFLELTKDPLQLIHVKPW